MGWIHLLGVVDVVDKLLDDGGGIRGLNTLAVVSDHSAGAGTDNNDALLALETKSAIQSAIRLHVPPKQSSPKRRAYLLSV